MTTYSWDNTRFSTPTMRVNVLVELQMSLDIFESNRTMTPLILNEWRGSNLLNQLNGLINVEYELWDAWKGLWFPICVQGSGSLRMDFYFFFEKVPFFDPRSCGPLIMLKFWVIQRRRPYAIWWLWYQLVRSWIKSRNRVVFDDVNGSVNGA